MSGDTSGWFIAKCSTRGEAQNPQYSGISAGGRVGCYHYSSDGQIGTTGDATPNFYYGINFSHTHTFDHFHYLWGDGGNEARPDNLTQIIWKRIS